MGTCNYFAECGDNGMFRDSRYAVYRLCLTIFRSATCSMCNVIIVLCANYTWSYCNRQCAVQRLTRPVEISVPTALQWLQSYKYVNTNQHNALFFNDLIQLYCLRHVSNIEVLILRKICTCIFFYVLLTVHLSIFISVINQLDAQNFCFTISFISCLYMFRARAHHEEVKIALHSLWYHHTYRWPLDDEHMC